MAVDVIIMDNKVLELLVVQLTLQFSLKELVMLKQLVALTIQLGI